MRWKWTAICQRFSMQQFSNGLEHLSWIIPMAVDKIRVVVWSWRLKKVKKVTALFYKVAMVNRVTWSTPSSLNSRLHLFASLISLLYHGAAGLKTTWRFFNGAWISIILVNSEQYKSMETSPESDEDILVSVERIVSGDAKHAEKMEGGKS